MNERSPVCINCNDAGCQYCDNSKSEGKKMFCPDCGGRMIDRQCDTCGLAQEDMEAAASFVDGYEPTPEDWELYDGDDCQPSEYDEWQDVFGGDVEEYGTFGEYDHYYE